VEERDAIDLCEFPVNPDFRIIQCRMSQLVLHLFVKKSASHVRHKTM